MGNAEYMGECSMQQTFGLNRQTEKEYLGIVAQQYKVKQSIVR